MGRRRWVRWLAGGAAALGVGSVVVAARRRAAPPGPEIYRAFATRFFLQHEALRRNLDRFVAIIDRDEASDNVAFGDAVRIYGEFLIVHHEGEDRFIFPTLRERAALRSTDAAHLDGWSGEHREINALATALSRAGEAVRSQGRQAYGELRGTVFELDEALRPHLAAEEQLINAERLAEMLSPAELHDLERRMHAALHHDERLLLFFVHSLRGDEQRKLIGEAPLLFRKLILPRWDRRLFARFAPLAVEPQLAV
jgi:hypothetical protein